MFLIANEEEIMEGIPFVGRSGKIIVCLGRVAAQRIISPGYKITRQHGMWTYRKDCALTAVYHPSAILRDPAKMEETKADFMEIVRKRDELLPVK